MNKRIAQTSQEVRHIWACWDFKSICRLIMDYSGDIIKILTKLETNVHVTRANVEYGGQSSILAAVSR